MPSFPALGDATIGFAHAAYELGAEFGARNASEKFFEVRNLDDLSARIVDADVLVVSGLWRNDLLGNAPRLRFIQSISAGVDQYDKARLAAAGVRLASAQGVNERAVAEHALALMLGFSRQLHLARDHQKSPFWRPMIADRRRREFELAGRTLVIVGFGRIGARLADLAAAFGMRVIGVRRNPPAGGPHRVIATDQLTSILPQADFLALTCPLTPETENLIGAAELAALKKTAFLINVSRGKVVNEEALLQALSADALAGVAMDCFRDEPLPTDSPFWSFANVVVTPHSAGETQAYEANVVDLLIDNLDRLRRGFDLRNGVV